MTAQTPAGLGSQASLYQNTTVAGLTAFAGGGATNAVVLTGFVNEVSICATNNDSVMLPIAYPGAQCTVINNGAATLAVFANTNNGGNADKIVGSAVAGGAGASSVTQATTKSINYVCYKQGLWKSFASA